MERNDWCLQDFLAPFTPQKLEDILAGKDTAYEVTCLKVKDTIEFVGIRNSETKKQYGFTRHSAEVHGPPTIADPEGLGGAGVLHMWNQLCQIGYVLEDKSN